ncbi:unnamed protein product [Cylicocyclus nassatus]|uniref:Transmembrane protein n=1 Tax=Cylicocyclus nassatus TaxID=53992 RepID=A0AA36MBY2_CYLNA|nr:unnamed protein product [Cylicocyclus nassatus]
MDQRMRRVIRWYAQYLEVLSDKPVQRFLFGNFRMLVCLRHLPARAYVCRSRIAVSSRTFADRISDAYNKNVQTEEKIAKDNQKEFTSRVQYDEQVKAQRTRPSDAEMTVSPTSWQKYFLVATGLFQSQKDVPHSVSNATMSRMHHRLRVIMLSMITLCFFVVVWYFKSNHNNRVLRGSAASALPMHKESTKGSSEYPSYMDLGGCGVDDERESYLNQISQFNTTFGCYSMSFF